MIPLIDNTTSILALTENQFFEFQPSLSNEAEDVAWFIVSGGLPEGVTLNADTGSISGVPTSASAGSVYCVSIMASNTSGDSPVVKLTFGVEYNVSRNNEALECIVDMDLNQVFFTSAMMDENGVSLQPLKQNDVLPLSVQFQKSGVVVPLSLVTLEVVIKEFEPDNKINLTPSGVLRTEGSRENRRFVVLVDLTNSALNGFLSNYEEDEGTFFDALCELNFSFNYDIGTEEPALMERSTSNFKLRIDRQLNR